MEKPLARAHRVVREHDITAAVGIKAVRVGAVQRRVYTAVRDGDAGASPRVQRPKRRVTKSDVGQQQVSTAPQLKEMTAGVIQNLTMA